MWVIFPGIKEYAVLSSKGHIILRASQQLVDYFDSLARMDSHEGNRFQLCLEGLCSQLRFPIVRDLISVVTTDECLLHKTK